MLTASSPINFPPSSSPPPSKRSRPHEPQPTKPKPRPKGPFVLDDDDDDDDGEDSANIPTAQTSEPLPKRRMIQHPRDESQGQTIKGEQAGLDTIEEGVSESHPQPNPRTEGPGPIIDTIDLTDAPTWTSQLPLFSRSTMDTLSPSTFTMRRCDGKVTTIKQRQQSAAVSYESLVAARSKTKEGRAKRSYYGIDIHELMSAASKELANRPAQPVAPTAPVATIERPAVSGKKSKQHLLWTEKYRARNFLDLCGDDGTNRLVLRWLKKWDPIVFPGAAKARPVIARRPGTRPQEEEKPHRKILMLTGPPGLGKTTLAHVCARQAGYDVMEINASDDRSKDVVKNRIRTTLGTETVRSVKRQNTGDTPVRPAKPACVVVDEVDGVVTGSGASGEGGFVRALMDLIMADQRNTSEVTTSAPSNGRKKKKGDDFRMMRPLILICNDVYHPSLRPLRQSKLAEIIHVGRPTIDAVVGRLRNVFEKEGIPCDKDAARKLTEAAWGITSGIDAKRGAESTVEGDLRGVMVVGEWVAGRFRSASHNPTQRLTRQWIDANILHDLQNGAAGSRGLGRGSVRDIVSRLFQEGGGFPKQALDLSEAKNQHEQPQTELGFGEHRKRYAMDRLRQMADTCGEISHILTEVFAEYPNREFNDDCYLTKPNQAYDWLHFHDLCQSRLYASQEWELAPYLSQPVLACHDLFASPKRHYVGMGFDKRWGGDAEDDGGPPMPFSGPRADYQAFEAEKQTRAQLQAMQSQLTPSLMRSFRSAEDVAVEFLPYLVRIVSPDVKPVVVGGSQGSTASVRKESERAMVKRAAAALAEVGISLHKGKIETETISSRGPEWVYRLEPDLDALATFETAASLLSSQQPVRFAVRQVLDQELQRTIAQRENMARQARFRAGGPLDSGKAASAAADREKLLAKTAELAAAGGSSVKRDFFGRIIEDKPAPETDVNSLVTRPKEPHKVWVTYHEGLNNAVRKPISLQEFLKGL